MVGASNPAPHRHPRFDIDEAALDIAADVLEQVVRAV
jgi:aminobenzoyl-glutamate utilization protein A